MNKETASLEEMKFEEAREELDTILEALESGEAELEELALSVKRASALLKHCRQQLVAAELEVEKVLEEIPEEES